MDSTTLQAFATKLVDRHITLAFAESVTCGMAASMLADLEGASLLLNGSIVAYCEEVKKSLLKVDPRIIEQCTAESQECTVEMVKGLRELIHSDISVAVTGLASPGGSEDAAKPVGSIFVSLWFRDKIYNFYELFQGNSYEIRKQAVLFIFRKIEEVLDQETL